MILHMFMIRKRFAGAAAILALCVLGCSTPVGVKPASAQTIYRQLTESALSGKRLSPYSSQILARLSLDERFKQDPQDTLAVLHAGLGGPDERERLFALAELSYLHAIHSRDPKYFMAAAVYAYVFLFPEDHAQHTPSFDPRQRLAMDIYNQALTNGLRAPKGGGIDLSPRRLALPFGAIDLSVDPSGFTYGGYELFNFIAIEDFKIHGLRNRYRKPGIGAALSAHVKPLAGRAASPWIPPQVKVPVTAFVRFQQPGRALRDGRLTGKIELYDVDVAPTTPIDGRPVPLESSPSAALAYRLNDSPLYHFEIAGFRHGGFNLFGEENQGALFFLTPWRPGLIPVVLVHGTASSPARWAQMLNELVNDPNIASRYQFWVFIYNSGNPIPLSAMHLREELQKAHKELDPEGKDPGLQNMVVIGHSQGGLLSKMTGVNSGTKFWDKLIKVPFDKAKLDPVTRDLLRRSIFIEPLPFVRRIIYISTPHHGSYIAEDFIGKLGRRFITLPASLSKSGAELAKLNPAGAASNAWRIPTAVDNMNWSNPFLRTLYSLPLAPGIKAHSIISVKGKGPIEKGNDGVVRYVDAHITEVQSEYVVRSPHSCQAKPHTIEEVRRILYEHAALR